MVDPNADNKNRLNRLSQGIRHKPKAISPTYTRFIRRARLALPLIAFIILGVVFSWSMMDDARFLPTPENDAQPARTIGKNELLNPRFESRDDKSQPYTITADRALQGRENEDLILLEGPLADLMMNNNHWLALKADQGLFNQADHNLQLRGQVELYHDAGYQMRTEELAIDMAASTATSKAPVNAHGPAGTLEAKGLQADQKTGTLSFTGPAKLVLTMNDNSEGLQGVFHE